MQKNQTLVTFQGSFESESTVFTGVYLIAVSKTLKGAGHNDLIAYME